MGTSVYVGILENGSEVAVKRMLMDSCKDAAENEKNILSLINTKKSPFIVSYRHFFKDTRFMYLVVDLCEETLDDHVHSQNLHHLRIHGRRLIKEMLTGLKFLHDQGILHRDLKPSNILVDVDGHIRLADFGISRVLNEDETTAHTDSKGTEGWMAVEVIQTIDQIGRGRFKKKSDIQSAGMVAFFILTKGGHPFGSIKYERMTNIVAGNPVYMVTLDGPDARQFISSLISHTIRDRPYAHEALLHPFMNNIDYEERARAASILFLEEYHN
ncbi:serine threonine- kinase endoribonuclease IRE1 [Paramuricea clavata]|uniref:Serine threonine- kinase endoribonuclease IRE1 n=1 Tax=Paramuricea clavata TaxID=317549 RepID=A0A7D9L142_PARCT|nr:serine threonine- kinase endoribonuclease IRE1 [Paramuricea clavata]